MVSKEKLIDGNLDSILQMLCQAEYGEHNIVIYPDLDSFREIYTHVTEARIKNYNDLVMLLPHYETIKSVQQSLLELDVDIREPAIRTSLDIIDSQHAFFDPEQDFLGIVAAGVNSAKRNGKSGFIVIADMGSFFHRGSIEQMISHECKIIPPKRQQDSMQFTLFCCYHIKDFQKLTKEQEQRMCENHYLRLFVRESTPDDDR